MNGPLVKKGTEGIFFSILFNQIPISSHLTSNMHDLDTVIWIVLY